MRIDQTDSLCGYPALEIRRFMRATQRHQRWNDWLVREVLDIGPRKALWLLRDLETEGYVERAKGVSGKRTWCCTVKGNALAAATSAKPVKRSTADRVLGEFLGRVEVVREDSYYLVLVHEVVVFGSYLSSGSYVNDVDLALRLVRRKANYKKHSVLARRRIQEATAAGRQFSNISSEMSWPRSRVLSLHDLDDNKNVIAAGPHKTIYEDKRAAKLPVA